MTPGPWVPSEWGSAPWREGFAPKLWDETKEMLGNWWAGGRTHQHPSGTPSVGGRMIPPSGAGPQGGATGTTLPSLTAPLPIAPGGPTLGRGLDPPRPDPFSVGGQMIPGRGGGPLGGATATTLPSLTAPLPIAPGGPTLGGRLDPPPAWSPPPRPGPPTRTGPPIFGPLTPPPPMPGQPPARLPASPSAWSGAGVPPAAIGQRPPPALIGSTPFQGVLPPGREPQAPGQRPPSPLQPQTPPTPPPIPGVSFPDQRAIGMNEFERMLNQEALSPTAYPPELQPFVPGFEGEETVPVIQALQEYEAAILGFTEEYDVPSTLAQNLIMSESSGRPGAIGPPITRNKGTPQEYVEYAYGLTQLLLGTAQEMADDINAEQGAGSVVGSGPGDRLTPEDLLEKPELNLHLGMRYISDLLKRYNGNPRLALMAYNGGIGNLDRWMENNPEGDVETGFFDESVAFANKILDNEFRVDVA